MFYEELADKVVEWGVEKGIVAHTEYQILRQLDQHEDELNEVREAVKTYYKDPTPENYDKMADEFGDLQVTVIIPAKCAAVKLYDSLELAYNKITSRTGRVINGRFVKD